MLYTNVDMLLQFVGHALLIGNIQTRHVYNILTNTQNLTSLPKNTLKGFSGALLGLSP